MRPPLRGQRICTKTQGGRNLGNLACAYGLMRKIKVNGSGQECPLHTTSKAAGEGARSTTILVTRLSWLALRRYLPV